MEEEAYAADMSAIMEPIIEEAVSTVEVTMEENNQKATALMPRGVYQGKYGADTDTRWLPETTIGFVVSMEGNGSNLPDTKTLVAKLNITLSEAASVEENEEYSGPEVEETVTASNDEPDGATDGSADEPVNDEATGG